jgi:hypothetical protein
VSGSGHSGFDFLRAFAERLWPDAVVNESLATGDFYVSVRVPRKDVVANRLEAARSVKAKLTPRQVTRRRLHWARRTRRRA